MITVLKKSLLLNFTHPKDFCFNKSLNKHTQINIVNISAQLNVIKSAAKLCKLFTIIIYILLMFYLTSYYPKGFFSLFFF